MFSWYKKEVVPKLLNKEMGSKKLAEIRREVLIDASGVVLEIGSGPGYNFAIYNGIEKLYALEPSKELTEIAKGRADSLTYPIEFLKAGAEQIPLPDNSVDTVVSTWTLCSVGNLEAVLQEVARVLKPEGKFIFADHGASPNQTTFFMQKLFTAISKYFTGNCHADREIEKRIKSAGFTIIEMKHPKERFHPLIYNYQGVARKN